MKEAARIITLLRNRINDKDIKRALTDLHQNIKTLWEEREREREREEDVVGTNTKGGHQARQ